MRQALNARTARAALGCWLLTAALALAACSGGNNNRGVNSSVGTSTSTGSTTTIGVSLTSSTGVASLNAGESITLTASLTNDTNNAGVTWTLSGKGTLTEATSTTVVYNAPTTLAGTSTPVVTATSIADTTRAIPADTIASAQGGVRP